MTTPSERNVALSRGKAMAATASASRIAALEYNRLAFVFEDDITVMVEGQYRFNLAGSSWVRVDDPSVHGYLVATLLADFRDRNSETPGDGHSRREDATSSSSWTLPSPGTHDNSSDLLPKVEP